MLSFPSPFSFFHHDYIKFKKKDDDFYIKIFDEWNSKYTFDYVDSIEKVTNMVIDLLKIPTEIYSKESVFLIGKKLIEISSKDRDYKKIIIKKMESRKNDSIVSYWRFELIFLNER